MNEEFDSTDGLSPILETAQEISERDGLYGEIKRALIARGVPAEEIAFVHDFPTVAKKAKAFAAVNEGRIRVIIASTERAGVGVNLQRRLFALHHIDSVWRPSDWQQREGRILRQGNISPKCIFAHTSPRTVLTATCGRRWRARRGSSARSWPAR